MGIKSRALMMNDLGTQATKSSNGHQKLLKELKSCECNSLHRIKKEIFKNSIIVNRFIFKVCAFGQVSWDSTLSIY